MLWVTSAKRCLKDAEGGNSHIKTRVILRFIVRDVLSDHTSVSVHPSLHRGVTPIAPLYPCLAESSKQAG
ncbi:hypothetical protein HYQ46_012255 [Verticillium longisporum]|nr:hypothetical protein HYQ46_012255 [Verticillium longisporum]